ncbi:MAG TPA: DUF4139 domain-containing protein [Chromatiaceae bacterium]|nr:DUF4139 domain-containing protein [Chromatiaceae bacterium]
MISLRPFIPFLFACVITPAGSDELVAGLEDQTGLAITIYNSNLALIKDKRRINLSAGISDLAIRGVSARMRPETALLRNIDHPEGLQVREQNFNFDLLTPEKMLEKYVGQTVEIIRMNPATGKETREAATILSTNSGVVAKIGGRIETNPEGRYVFPSIPANLRDKPTLVTQLINKTTGSQELELSYLSQGLGWKADYVAELNSTDDSLDLAGWVTLTNDSGATYPKAKLQLIAGDVNQVQEQINYRRKAPAMAMMSDAAPAPMAEEALFEYHLYTLAHPTTIADKQTKQVSLLNASRIPVTKELVFRGNDYYYRSVYRSLGEKLKAAVYIKFQNKEASGMGMPLPKGIVRVYKRDSSGNAQFVGEDRVDHTPKNEEISLRLGEAFDVTAKKTQVNYKKANYGHPYSFAAESTYRMELKNAKDQPIKVKVQEPIPGDWKILRESSKHKKISSGVAEWQIDIPAEGATLLEYKVLVRY